MNKRNIILILCLLFILCFLVFLILYRVKNNFTNKWDSKNSDKNYNNTIIGYFHICQKENWEKSFDMILQKVKQSGLYDIMDEIRLGIVNDDGVIINDERLNDPKIHIIYVGKSDEYERPTLLHMKNATSDPEDTLYFYLHTKGIRHYNTHNEKDILQWINDMLYWNIEKWQYSVEILQEKETYGCNYNGIHYSGNFWWTTKNHVKKLPPKIGDKYTDPEDWILKNKDNMFCVNNCPDNYKPPYPDNLYP